MFLKIRSLVLIRTMYWKVKYRNEDKFYFSSVYSLNRIRVKQIKTQSIENKQYTLVSGTRKTFRINVARR